MKTFGVKVIEDGITFDSQLEHLVYINLKKFFGKDKIKVHHAIDLALAEDVTDDYYLEMIKPVKWRVDFYIPDVDLIIEAKGRWMPADRFKILALVKLLDVSDKVFRVVSPNKPPNSWFNKKADAFSDIFMSLKDFVDGVKHSYDTEDFLVALGAL